MKMVRTGMQITWQVALLTLISLACNALADRLHWGIPGSIIGMLLLFLLLRLKLVRLQWVEVGAQWLLGELLLFYIPAAMGIMQYKAMLMTDGWRILLVIVISTGLVMAGTGLLVEWIGRRRGEQA